MHTSLADSACFKTKVLQQAPKPQGIHFSLHAVPSNDGHICASTTLQIALNAFVKVPSCNALRIHKCYSLFYGWR